MTVSLTGQQFRDSEGVDDWRVIFEGACTYFRTGSFATGVALIHEIGTLADEANHHPDVDLRYSGVTVRLITHETGGITDRDLALARQISEAASRLGVSADPGAVQTVQLAIDALDRPGLMAFWRAVLGYRNLGTEDLVDPHGHGPSIWFQETDTARAGRHRIHVDVSVPHDVAEARIAAALQAGGRLVNDRFAPTWWTLADPEGNEVDIATWQGRD